MKITALQKHVDDLPDTLKKPILAIIELKTDSDMEKALSKMESIEHRMENIENRLESKMDIQFKMMLWTIGIAFTLIGVLITLYKFIG